MSESSREMDNRKPCQRRTKKIKSKDRRGTDRIFSAPVQNRNQSIYSNSGTILNAPRRVVDRPVRYGRLEESVATMAHHTIRRKVSVCELEMYKDFIRKTPTSLAPLSDQRFSRQFVIHVVKRPTFDDVY